MGTYQKGEGVAGIQGQLYETKLISLIYFRMKHDANVIQFSLASNRGDIGAFDDICFKAEIKGFEKPVTVFIQAKHRENNQRLTFTSEFDLTKYFKSYLKIRHAFELNSEDKIIEGKFDATECFFVMYTTAKVDCDNKIYTGSFSEYLSKLIGTGGCCTQPTYTDAELDLLCKLVTQEEIKLLAKFIFEKSGSVKWMSNDLIFRYHVILAHSVLHVSEIKPEGHRIASFREDLFTTNDEFLVLLKNMLCLEFLRKQKLGKIDVHSLLLKFLSSPSDETALSKLIESVLTYKKGKLEFVSKSVINDLKQQLEEANASESTVYTAADLAPKNNEPKFDSNSIIDNLKGQLDKVNVSQSTFYAAAQLAAKEELLTQKLKVPASFGNKDLKIGGTAQKIEKELKYLTLKIIKIIKKSKPDNIVTIDESLGKQFLELDTGIASAVGNILVFDESSKLLKFTDNYESLGNLAKTCYDSLKSEFENLHEYKFDVKVKKFPKISFVRGEYDISLVSNFYDKLLFYSNQANQNGIEHFLKGEIEAHPCSNVNNFRVRSDFIFLKYHDKIQKEWITPKRASYLTKDDKIYENAVADALREPLMGALNIMHKIKNKEYTFNEKAIEAFELDDQIIGSFIDTTSCVLTVAKVVKYLGTKDHFVLDLEYIFQLPLITHNTLCEELKNTIEEKILVIVCRNFKDSKNGRRLQNIAEAVEGKKLIIIRNKTSVDDMTKYFSQVRTVLNDKRSVFTDLTPESQKYFLATSTIKVQGEDVSLDIIGDDESEQLIDEDVFNKLINNEIIEIGNAATYNNYRKEFYIDRRVSRTKASIHDKFNDVKDKDLKTFYDLEDRVVLITGELGMGKSTLLTHLSLKTKELHPKVWIVRINLPEHERMVRILNENTVNTSDFFKFLCQAALGEEYDKRQQEEWRKEEGELTIEVKDVVNRTVFPMKCLGGESKVFQLKMFLHYYNTGNLIFLFDGLDQIKITSKSQLETAVLSLQTIVRSIYYKHRVWITSRSLNIIEQELGPSYKLENFSRLEQETHLNKIWKYNIQQLINNIYFKEILENIFFGDHMHMFLSTNHNMTEYLRGYALFLDFLKIESTAAGVNFPDDQYRHKFMKEFVLCESAISCFPDDTTPWDLTALAQRFTAEFQNLRDFFFPNWPLRSAGREERRLQKTNIKLA